MAFTGVHVVCAEVILANGASLRGPARWSQTMAAPATTSQAVPAVDGTYLLEIAVSADSWIAIGKTPSATLTSGTDDSARYLLLAGAKEAFRAFPGQCVAWTQA